MDRVQPTPTPELWGRLPIRQTPWEWEALGGYLLRAARTLWMSVPELLAELSLGGRADALERVTIDADTAVRRELTNAFGLSEDQIERMTSAPFASGTLNKLRSTQRVLTAVPVCTRCVAVGRWDVRWFTGLQSVCNSHRTLLRVRCMGCNGVVELATTRVRDDRRAFVHGDPDDPCPGGPVSRPDMSVIHASDVAARLVEASIGQGTRHDVVDALRTVVMLRRSRTPRKARDRLADAADHGRGADVRAAIAIATAGTEHAAADPAIIELVRVKLRASGQLVIPAHPDPGAHDRVAAAVRRAEQRRHLERPVVDVPLPGFTGEHRFVPLAVPVEVFTSVLADMLGDLDLEHETARNVASLAAVQPAGRQSWAAAAKLLGTSPEMARMSSATVSEIEARGGSEVFWEQVSGIRTGLLRHRIDFRARAGWLYEEMQTPGAQLRYAADERGVSPSHLIRWLLDRWACVTQRNLPPGPLRRVASDPEAFEVLDQQLRAPAAWPCGLAEILTGNDDAAVQRYA